MCKIDIKNGDTRIDPCMRELIKFLNNHGIKTKMCCCGHNVYPMSIIIQHPKFKNLSVEIFSGCFFKDKKKVL